MEGPEQQRQTMEDMGQLVRRHAMTQVEALGEIGLWDEGSAIETSRESVVSQVRQMYRDFEHDLTRAYANGRDARQRAERDAARTSRRMAADEFLSAYANGQREFANVVLTDADLSGIDLSGVGLRDADLQGVNLRDTNLSDANLTGASLVEADLTGTNLRHTWFVRADLTGALLDGADCQEANFCDAQMRVVTANGARMNRADFTGADLTGIDLARAKLRTAKCAHAKFDKADLTGTDLSGALLDGATFEAALCPPPTHAQTPDDQTGLGR